jgi:hypothetical protein
MSPAQRRDLIRRLEKPLAELLPTRVFERVRRLRLVLMVGATLSLIPWIVYLALTLPGKYVAHNWTATWVGFDVLLLMFMAATAVLGYLRRQLLLLAAFTTGVLLVCDAWFDVMTATPTDRWISVLTAVLGELPLSALLITGALRILRLTATRLWLLDPHTHLWQVPLLP